MAGVASLQWHQGLQCHSDPACGLPAPQAATIAEALAAGRCDFGFLHVKAVDDTGHDRAAASKAGVNSYCCANTSTAVVCTTFR